MLVRIQRNYIAAENVKSYSQSVKQCGVSFKKLKLQLPCGLAIVFLGTFIFPPAKKGMFTQKPIYRSSCRDTMVLAAAWEHWDMGWVQSPGWQIRSGISAAVA